MQNTLIRSYRNALLLSIISFLLIACQSISSSENPGSTNPISNRTINPNSKVTTVSVVPSSTLSGPENYDDLWQRMRSGFQLEEFYSHQSVATQLDSYTDNQRYFDLITERAAPFLHFIVEEIERRGLPQEIALLPVVESTFNPNAYSPEHAVGLWQFLGSTGSDYGLQQDWWYDGRRDPKASTIAALDFLEVLYKKFDQDWLLALAAYNTGDGNVRRAIKRSGINKEEVDFWSLGLASETRAHIPKLLALAAVISDGEQYGVTLTPLPNRAILETVEIGSQIDLSQAAKLAGMEYSQLRALNPGYLQWATHPDQPQQLSLPSANVISLLSKLKELDESEFVTWDRYEIRPGDTLGAIARRLDTRVDILQSVNDLRGSQIIAGDSLLIPRGGNSNLVASAPTARGSRNISLNVPAKYTIRRGDNLWNIARRYNLRSIEIAAWNQIELDHLLKPGQVLDLQYATEQKGEGPNNLLTEVQASYLVRPGDSMARIATQFDLKLEDLLMWNNISSNELIHPGQTIQFFPQDSEIN